MISAIVNGLGDKVDGETAPGGEGMEGLVFAIGAVEAVDGGVADEIGGGSVDDGIVEGVAGGTV